MTSSALAVALSGIFGSISLTAWIFLLLPQLYVNFKAKSAQGLSLAFLFVWSLGDVANLSGALLTNLAPSAIALAGYFCILDLTLISQCLYYNALNARHLQSTEADDDGNGADHSPLLARRQSSSTDVRQASDMAAESSSPKGAGATDNEDAGKGTWTRNTLCMVGVYVIGLAGWFVSYKAGAWGHAAPSVPGPPQGTDEMRATVGLVLGYVSAVFYLCARIPQIVKNYREKSCEGLSLLFFMLSLTGNLTYGLSLLAYSQKADYLVKSLPWLLGSLGTMVEDATIFVQFRLYAGGSRTSSLDP
ncbi:hypothetical protein L249_2919 [Ophiocordyceps polyrhachis-furcata BCC 54312]|uniref:Uncharacterized protein n=1 Tax=Ophiocordyceps polyrhachis-furcata BCC 54312 TaxID=1330021 RepID=A0A367LMW8_9HYPO|nr:hypothetical protein L249_2919 [Ophiocordyceps polyrhachis-furcata BCC 54312]